MKIVDHFKGSPTVLTRSHNPEITANCAMNSLNIGTHGSIHSSQSLSSCLPYKKEEKEDREKKNQLPQLCNQYA